MKRFLGVVGVLLVVSPLMQGELKHRRLRGDVVVRNNGGDLYNLVVLVDAQSRGRKRDGNIDYVFGIRSDASYGVVHERLRDAQVTIDGDRVTIRSSEDDRAFVLAKAGAATPEWLDAGARVRTFNGHSLVATEGKFGAERNLVDRLDAGDPMD